MQIAHVIVRDVHFTQGKAGYNGKKDSPANGTSSSIARLLSGS
jgi:hypothetical protein